MEAPGEEGSHLAERGEFLAGMIVGTLVGAGLGLLFAPRSGQETRERIRSRADEMGDRLRSTAGDLGDRVREKADDLSRRGRAAVEEGSRRLRTAYERGRKGVAPGHPAGGLGDGEQA